MSWPVDIILPAEVVPKIKWKRWSFSLLFVFLIMAFFFWLLKVNPAFKNENAERVILPFILIAAAGYLVCLSMRIYYHGMCLSAYDAYEQESESLREIWTEWARQKVFMPASHFFLPSEVSSVDILAGEPVDVFSGQSLKLRGHDGDAYTEEQLLYELLSSVRIKLKELSATCMFDVIFTHKENHYSFALFKECWLSIGLAERCLAEHSFVLKNCEDVFERCLCSNKNKVFIVISINIESTNPLSFSQTEFASIILMSPQCDFIDGNNACRVLRPMQCEKKNIKEKFTHMQTYQSEINSTSRVLFSGMDVNEIATITDVFRNATKSARVNWEYEGSDLNLLLGQLGGEHYWLVLALSLHYSNTAKRSVLMINDLGDDYVFNVISLFDNNKEATG
jgi:hypothetical protein